MIAAAGGSGGLGIVVLAVGLVMAGGAALSLRSIWGRESPGPDGSEEGRPPFRSPGVGQIRNRFRLLLSVDFGCLAATAAVLLFLGFVLIFRSL